MNLSAEEQSSMYDQVKENTYDISSIAKRMDSYHLDTKAQIKSLPTRDEIKLMFVDESRKLAEGLGTRIDETKQLCESENKIINSKIDNIEKIQGKTFWFASGIGSAVTGIGGLIAWLGGLFR